MFSWLGRRSEPIDHPMSSMAEARKLLAELPEDDNARALEEVTSWLTSVTDTPGFDPVLRFDIITLLDETGWPLHTERLTDYLSAPHLHDFQGVQAWRRLLRFTMELARAYDACLKGYLQAKPPPANREKILPPLCTRALRASGEEIKLYLLRYIDIPPAAWQQLYRFHAAAESAGVAQTLLSFDAWHRPETCPQHQFLRTLMLYVSSPANLAPDQIELCFRITRRLADLFDLTVQPDSDSEYWLDLDGDSPPSPYAGEAQSGTAVRYFGAIRALAAIREIMKWNDGDEPAEERRFGDDFSPDGKLAMLRHLHAHWDRDHPHRKMARRNTIANIEVVHGFHAIARIVPHYELDKVPDLSGADRVALTARSQIGLDSDYLPEMWTVTDASLSGMGAMVPRKGGAWLTAGSLCGIKLQNAELWWIGVVRRLHTDQQDIAHVGIEILAKRSRAVWLRRRAAAGGEHPGAYDYFPAILLPDAHNSYVDATLLLEAGSYEAGKQEEILLGENFREIILTGTADEGKDFERVTIRWLNP